jgi:hypothetical protein
LDTNNRHPVPGPRYDRRTEPSEIPQEWLEEFEAAARRPLEQRFRYAFIKTYKPVMDDEPYRSFDSMEEYRRWCEENLPPWLGYGRV